MHKINCTPSVFQFSYFLHRTHPWTTYAVFQTTLTAWAFVDPLLFFLCFKATENWPVESRNAVLIAAGTWIFAFAKSVKLMGHFVRYPADICMLPVSIMFGYIHGILKLIGLLTLNEVSSHMRSSSLEPVLTASQTAWGSREGADTDDKLRMIRLPPYEAGESQPLASSSATSFQYGHRLPPYTKVDLDDIGPLQLRFYD